MNVVGRVGSLISQGVYSVATPFHPFGGAVDVIVVEQEDGTYRSTPWYVRFGKFQGVLKGAEKIVRISVNGVEANFHMFLDNSGEAYFVREVESCSTETESNNKVCNDSKLPEPSPESPDSSISKNDAYHDNDEESNEKVENGGYEFQDDRSSHGTSAGSPRFTPYHYGSLDEVEDMVESSQDPDVEMVLVSVDGHVLTAPISSNEENTENVQLSTPQFHLGPGDNSGDDFGSDGDVWVAGLLSDLNASSPKVSETSGYPAGVPESSKDCPDYDQEARDIGSITQMTGGSEEFGSSLSRKDTFMSCLDISELTMEDSNSQKDGSEFPPGNSPSSIAGQGGKAGGGKDLLDGARASFSSSVLTFTDKSEDIITTVEEGESNIAVNSSSDCVYHDHDSVNSDSDARQTGPCSDSQLTDELPDMNIKMGSDENKSTSTENVDEGDSIPIPAHSPKSDTEWEGEAKESSPSRYVSEEGNGKVEISESPSESSISTLGFEVSLCGNLLRAGMGNSSANEIFENHRVSREDFEASGESIAKNKNLVVGFKGKYFRWDKAAHIVLGMAVFGENLSVDLKDAVPVEQEVPKLKENTPALIPSPSGRGWRLWPNPFRRAKSFQHTNLNSSNVEEFVDSESISQSPQTVQSAQCNGHDGQSPRKQFIRTNVPTTEQIASLNLKDGQNMIAFSFCTRVLGKQQVDAHIYLWKWNARIVISDVDGTITKSDVLGQFMPLVGKDWSQLGVAPLFSAIKENGYQLLFLSARAIVQAYLTRSFLLNLKQDGKTLPNGPIVISPDGLFPSLYREVIRRAPHEFKIACLEDIKALFPSDYNPFYAGFGNRDTDELSYRKIGIPKGKIFIINPKGEVAINHRIDVKSYTSLHTLVNDMFPPTSLAEQEDYNSWNYWKMPLPSIDID